jgi:endonuclease G, mitochondrial
VVDQRSLLSETRRNLGQPQAVSAVDVSHWRLSITSIERRAGLDFGATVRDADTISHEGQPQVGEAQIMVKSFADLLPRAISG